ncbi:MAG: cell wall biogenesis glycosyltransferase [Acidobacteriota bacterium]
MSDFHQQGIITTIHDLGSLADPKAYLAFIEAKLAAYSRHRRLALLLPALYGELQQAAVLDKIISQIRATGYLHHVTVALGGTSDFHEYRDAVEYFSRLAGGQRSVRVVWVEGPRLQEILALLEEKKVPVGSPGKGQSVWLALGYLFAREDNDVIALHDCDIVTYDRILLARLLEPVANPNNDFEFCKGYYPRISPVEHAMKGRVTRLFVFPLVDALAGIMEHRGQWDLVRFFRYHHTFRYPLAGEISFTSRLARGLNIAFDWALEVSTLSEVYERIVPRKIAQIDLCCLYEHKHQDVSLEDSRRGLHRMVADIGRYYLNYMRSHGVPLNSSFVDAICQTYYRNALRFVKLYSDDAEVNNLQFDRYQEELTVRHFRDFLWEAWHEVESDPSEMILPSWNRVIFSIPDIYDRIREAVEADTADAGG